MKNLKILLTVVAAASCVAGLAALASLFDRYDVKADFAQTAGVPAWGGPTTWVATDGKGTVIVMIRAVPYFRVFSPEGKPVKTWGEEGLFNQAHSVHFAPDGSVWA